MIAVQVFCLLSLLKVAETVTGPSVGLVVLAETTGLSGPATMFDTV